MGITVRELNGWSPASVTRSADGSLVSVSVTEPRFTPSEKALLLAARRVSLQPTGPHGVRMADAVDPGNMGKFQVSPPSVDFAAKALFEARKKVRLEHGEEAADNYLLLHVELKD